MKTSSSDLLNQIDDFFKSPPTTNQKAWGIINDFYNLILNFMDENNITKSELAHRLGKSRSAISQIFNKTPNLTIRRMVEIADSIGIDIGINVRRVSTNVSKRKIVFKEFSTMVEEIPFNKNEIPMAWSKGNSTSITKLYKYKTDYYEFSN